MYGEWWYRDGSINFPQNFKIIALSCDDGELESLWKEGVVQLENQSRHLAGEAKQYHENLSQDSRYDPPRIRRSVNHVTSTFDYLNVNKFNTRWRLKSNCRWLRALRKSGEFGKARARYAMVQHLFPVQSPSFSCALSARGVRAGGRSVTDSVSRPAA